MGSINIATAKGANVIDEAITSKSPPYAKSEVKKIYAQCSGAYTLMIGLFTVGPFRDSKNSSNTSNELKRMDSFFRNNGISRADQDFEKTSESAYEKFRDYFNQNNFTKEGQIDFLNEYRRVSNICVDFAKRTN